MTRAANLNYRVDVLDEDRPLLKSSIAGPAPRVALKSTAGAVSIEPAPCDAESVEDWQARYLAAFGTTDQTIAEALFQQLLSALHADPKKPLDCTTANLALALMHSLAPADVTEAMIAIQMVVAHVAAMGASRRALHVEQTVAGRAAYLGLARKLMTLFTTQMDALNRHRGKGTTQKIVIERVYVAPGGPAVVGAISNGGRGDGI